DGLSCYKSCVFICVRVESVRSQIATFAQFAERDKPQQESSCLAVFVASEPKTSNGGREIRSRKPPERVMVKDAQPLIINCQLIHNRRKHGLAQGRCEACRVA